jgi:hypothetical protein
MPAPGTAIYGNHLERIRFSVGLEEAGCVGVACDPEDFGLVALRLDLLT